MSNGKGDTQRPKQISDAEYERNWERTFGRNDGEPSEHRRSPTTANRVVPS